MEEYLQEEIPKELQMMKNTRWKSRDPILPSNLILEDAPPETKGSSSISKFKEKRQRLHYDNHPRTYAKFILLTLVLFGLYNCINCIIDINCYYWYCHCLLLLMIFNVKLACTATWKIWILTKTDTMAV